MTDVQSHFGSAGSEGASYRPDAPKAAPAQTNGGRADETADRIVVLVESYFEELLAAGDDTKHRSFTRKMTICALLLEQIDPSGAEASLARAVAAFRRTGTRTHAALMKTASESRAFLRYGVTPSKVVQQGPQSEADLRRSIAGYDWMLMSINQRDVLIRRAQDLSGRRGGRPYKHVFRVLAAVAQLQKSAAQGDTMADAELQLLHAMVQK
jgi:hypothetical protein